eukprot:9922142-Ditylum_brightwellii.AAC.1
MQFMSKASTLAMKMLVSLILGCYTLESASDCGCCLPSNPQYYNCKYTGCGCSCCSRTLNPTWADCVADWSICCSLDTWENGSGNYHPMYIGVDWVSGAGCCALCN